MASSDPEIKDGFSLPVWMKTKPTRYVQGGTGINYSLLHTTPSWDWLTIAL